MPGIKVFRQRLKMLIRQPIFVFITVWGHLSIAAGTLGLYYFEKGTNPKIQSFLDTLYWSIATVTTVGYGDTSPVTTGGKIVGIVMMILGSLFLWSYTALFAGGLVAPEIHLVEKQVKELEEDVEHKIQLDKKTVGELLSEIQILSQELKKRSEK